MLQFLLQKMECSCWNVGIPRKKKKRNKKEKKKEKKKRSDMAVLLEVL